MIGMAQDVAFMEYHMLVGGQVEIHLEVRLSFYPRRAVAGRSVVLSLTRFRGP